MTVTANASQTMEAFVVSHYSEWRCHTGLLLIPIGFPLTSFVCRLSLDGRHSDEMRIVLDGILLQEIRAWHVASQGGQEAEQEG